MTGAFARRCMEKFMRIVLVAAALLALASCAPPANSQNSVGNGSNCPIVDYGNGVYYFDCIEGSFADALSRFKAAEPNYEVTAMTADGNGGYGRDTGYFVSVEPRS